MQQASNNTETIHFYRSVTVHQSADFCTSTVFQNYTSIPVFLTPDSLSSVLQYIATSSVFLIILFLKAHFQQFLNLLGLYKKSINVKETFQILNRSILVSSTNFRPQSILHFQTDYLQVNTRKEDRLLEGYKQCEGEYETTTGCSHNIVKNKAPNKIVW